MRRSFTKRQRSFVRQRTGDGRRASSAWAEEHRIDARVATYARAKVASFLLPKRRAMKAWALRLRYLAHTRALLTIAMAMLSRGLTRAWLCWRFTIDRYTDALGRAYRALKHLASRERVGCAAQPPRETAA